MLQNRNFPVQRYVCISSRGPLPPLDLELYSRVSQGFRPYVEVRNGLQAKISRPVYYQLAEHAEKGPDGRLGVWSNKQFFALEL